MNPKQWLLSTALAFNLSLSACAVTPVTVEAIPKSWIDADTGHKIVRLSEEPFVEYIVKNMYIRE